MESAPAARERYAPILCLGPDGESRTMIQTACESQVNIARCADYVSSAAWSASVVRPIVSFGIAASLSASCSK